MQHNKNDTASNKPPKKKRGFLPALTSAELEFLLVKRFIDDWDVMRLFQISESTLYNWIKKDELTPSRIGGKKFFDIRDIYKKLEEGKGK